jgi:O-succinylbenzoate synthase
VAGAAAALMDELLRLEWRPFRFDLPRPLRTAAGVLDERRGWLLRLGSSQGGLGWGEAAPLPSPPLPALADRQRQQCAAAIADLGPALERAALERWLPELPPALAFAIGAALAELDGLVGEAAGGWLAPPPTAWLLPAGAAMPAALEQLLADQTNADTAPLTLKWKVAVAPDRQERQLLELLLQRLPAGARLRLDANGGWERATAAAWADRLVSEMRLEWLEQPLAPADGEGLQALARRLPVALDESLRLDLRSGEGWSGWQVRRPLLDGDPRPLLHRLSSGAPRLMLSTALETGIGRRWLHHLAALQWRGPTPTAAGLAPGWQPRGGLWSVDPVVVWQAAGEAGVSPAAGSSGG